MNFEDFIQEKREHRGIDDCGTICIHDHELSEIRHVCSDDLERISLTAGEDDAKMNSTKYMIFGLHSSFQ